MLILNLFRALRLKPVYHLASFNAGFGVCFAQFSEDRRVGGWVGDGGWPTF